MLATTKSASNARTTLNNVLGSCKGEISWHFPSASGHIVFSEVLCNFTVRGYVLLHEYILGSYDCGIVVPVAM